ncbi:MAG: hypothetical protein ASARMPREDX12_004798 [Alectoria sarmentosa]|nr:MAG: hypothetical protein ASARMPREDX12_004798 [Alectoria sarmentosa]
MDLAKTLIRSVVRAFYDTPFILVIDALMIAQRRSCTPIADAQQRAAKVMREVEGGPSAISKTSSHSRLEFREGQQRPINKDYYYVDFHATIDAIKYRIFRLTQKVKETYKPSDEKKDFCCPRCKAQWTELEVLDNVGPIGFECHRCGGLLEREPDAGDSAGHAKQSKLMSQLDGLLKMLQQVDSEDIPSNDFDTAFSLSVAVNRDENVNPQQQSAPLNAPKPLPIAVKGMAQLVAAQLDVSVTTGSEGTTAEQIADAKRKATIAAQNILPVWHTTSTVTGEATVVGKKDGEQQANGGAFLKEEEDERKISDEDEQLEAYYAEVKREQQREKEAKEREAEAASEDEDEGDFEDVLGASPNGTPSSSLSETLKGSQPPRPNESVKRKGSESGSSVPATDTSTPAGSGPAIEERDGPVSKKVKFNNEENGTSAVKDEAGEQVDKDSDEDEEADFEDAL